MSLLEERGWARVACLAVLILGAVLRLADMPQRNEARRDIDEQGYLKGSLLLVEGLPPGYKAAPAGPNTWLGWAVTMGRIGVTLVKPPASIAGVPLLVRPFLAVDRVLFDQYRDLNDLRQLWIVTQLALTIVAIGAAFRWGQIKGGTCGGLLFGGFFALTPIFIDLTVMARPYATAWAFGLLALWAAAVVGPKRRSLWTGLLFGLAVASRVEMFLIAPLIAWTIWDRGDDFSTLCRTLFSVGVWTVMAALLTAPWLLTNLIGTLRTISTVRFGPNPRGETTLGGVLLTFCWTEGLLGILLALGAGLLFLPFRNDWTVGRRTRYMLLALYVLALVISMAKGTIYYHQQAPVLLAMMAFSAIALASATKNLGGRWRLSITLVLLLLPLGQSVSRAWGYRRAYVADPSVDWVIAHVPAGTGVYQTWELHSPLPTAESSKAIWTEVTDDAAWRKKFESGLERFNLPTDLLPRALSEENLVQERGNRRGLFILGGQTDRPEPRYNIHLYQTSPIFGLKHMTDEWPTASGVLIWHGVPDHEHFGQPVASWVNANGNGTFIYCTPGVRRTLINLKAQGVPATIPSTGPTTLP